MFYELGEVPTVGIVELLNERHGYKLPPGQTARKKERLYLEMVSEIAPIEPVVAIVNEVYGRLPLAVASGGRRSIVISTLDALGITDKFAAIVGADDYVLGKPAPDPFLTAAQKLGVDPARCLVFEDTQIGIQAAEAAGMKSVLVPPPTRVG
ncbi:MAG: hypothetical protein QOD99_1633 [Chthoniobacter sp.]|jgi:HAD superfamily hydrolase (TIGR01509 family)|nr:hypothetical protein [Chthoniobacter sp.]